MIHHMVPNVVILVCYRVRHLLARKQKLGDAILRIHQSLPSGLLDSDRVRTMCCTGATPVVEDECVVAVDRLECTVEGPNLNRLACGRWSIKVACDLLSILHKILPLWPVKANSVTAARSFSEYLYRR